MATSGDRRICPHCGAECPASDLITVCSVCFGSLDGVPVTSAPPEARAEDIAPPSVTPFTSVSAPPAPIEPVALVSAPLSPSEPVPPMPSASASRFCPDCGLDLTEVWDDCPRCAIIRILGRRISRLRRIQRREGPPRVVISTTTASSSRRANCGCAGCLRLIFLAAIACAIFRPDVSLGLGGGTITGWVTSDDSDGRANRLHVERLAYTPDQTGPDTFSQFRNRTGQRISQAINHHGVDPMTVRWQNWMKSRPPSASMRVPTSGERAILCRLHYVGLISPVVTSYDEFSPDQEQRLRLEEMRRR